MKCVVLAYHNVGRAGIEALIRNGFEISAIFTHRDNPGENIWFGSVAELAGELGIPVFAPEDINHPVWVGRIRAMAPDFIFSFYFRDMVKGDLLSIPRLGALNLHGSLLPKYRGRVPINWAIINGETETGVTTFLLNHEIDKGGIIGQVRVPILPEDNVGTLYDKLMTTGTALVTSTVDRIAAGDIRPVEQQHIDESTLRPAPKIFKEDCRIDWTLPGRRIADFIRGLSPYPAAWTEMFREEDEEPQSAKVFSATFEAAAHSQPCGTVESDGRTFIRVACADGWIVPGELQIAGKKRLAVRDLLLGWRDVNQYRFKK